MILFLFLIEYFEYIDNKMLSDELYLDLPIRRTFEQIRGLMKNEKYEDLGNIFK